MELETGCTDALDQVRSKLRKSAHADEHARYCRRRRVLLKSCVVVFAQREDIHAERLCEEVVHLGTKAFRVDVEDINQLKISFSNGSFRFALPSGSFEASDVRSVFVRRRPTSRDFGITDRAPQVSETEYIALQNEFLFQDAYFNLEESARFYNSLTATTRFMGKLNQDHVAARVGLEVAKTLVSVKTDEVVAFVEKIWSQGGQVCSKPLAAKDIESDGRLLTRYTEILDPKTDIHSENFEDCPIIFQEYIEKDYELRVTVIDSFVSAIRIDSQHAPGGTKTDWRKYNIPRTPHTLYELPRSLKEQLLHFHELTGLRYSAFDLIRSKDGRYIFLETNPSGQWLWLENITGTAITAGIAEALCAR